jgi:hypothetical protein
VLGLCSVAPSTVSTSPDCILSSVADDVRLSVNDLVASGLFALGRGVISGASSKVSYAANMSITFNAPAYHR